MLMVGAGGIYFRRSDDENQLHFLGNCTQFNLTTDVTTVEKYSSMNKKRELMAAVTTQTKASGSIVLNEYNMYNLALGLYGTEGVHIQQATQLTSEPYVVPSVPGIVELKDADGNRYMNVTSVAVAPASAVLPEATFAGGATTYTPQASDSTTPGGTITINGVGYTGTTSNTYVIAISSANGTPGDMDQLEVKVASSLLDMQMNNVQMGTGTAAGQTLSVTIDGITVTFDIGAGDSFPVADPTVDPLTTYITFTATPGVNTYKEGKDYVIEEESIRGGLIKIKKGGAIQAGDTIRVSATVPEMNAVTVSGSAAGKITGELLFVGDPNQGNALMIEAWKCNIKPDGDLTGLIGDDFGEFT